MGEGGEAEYERPDRNWVAPSLVRATHCVEKGTRDTRNRLRKFNKISELEGARTERAIWRRLIHVIARKA
jgi:hypothetical protein